MNVYVVEHSYSELANLLDMAAYNLALVDRSKPQATWKDDPNFMAVLLWWWTPEPTLEKWKYAGDQWKVSHLTPLRNMNGGGAAIRMNGGMGSSILVVHMFSVRLNAIA